VPSSFLCDTDTSGMMASSSSSKGCVYEEQQYH
jgi:hypothetical protein